MQGVEWGLASILQGLNQGTVHSCSLPRSWRASRAFYRPSSTAVSLDAPWKQPLRHSSSSLQAALGLLSLWTLEM